MTQIKVFVFTTEEGAPSETGEHIEKVVNEWLSGQNEDIEVINVSTTESFAFAPEVGVPRTHRYRQVVTVAYRKS